MKKETKSSGIKYIVDGITHIIKTFEKRPPGSKGERDAQNYMASELEKTMDKVWIEDFDLHPSAFMGWIYITVSLILLAVAMFWVSRLLTLVFVLLALVPMLTQLILYKETFDFLFKKATSCNVVSVKAPKGEVKRRIVLNGHADATWEWTFLYKFGFKFMVVAFVLVLIGALFFIGVSVIDLIINGVAFGAPTATFTIIWYCGLVFVPVFLAFLWFSDEKTVVDGANDNLSGCYIPMAVAKALKDESIELENTELMVVLSGSEEAGLRGAKRYAAKHAPDILADEKKGIDTIFIPVETFREKEHISVIKRDLNMTVPCDFQVMKLICDAGAALGYDIPRVNAELGSTDAAAFTQAGLKATCLVGMDHELKPYYHTRRDTYDNLCEETLGIGLDILYETTLKFDREGLSELPIPTSKK